jgi:hypothetical protein
MRSNCAPIKLCRNWARGSRQEELQNRSSLAAPSYIPRVRQSQGNGAVQCISNTNSTVTHSDTSYRCLIIYLSDEIFIAVVAGDGSHGGSTIHCALWGSSDKVYQAGHISRLGPGQNA